jgi:hypothetical protein
MQADKQLILAAAKMSRVAPESWEQFLAAFRTYTDITRDNCISSPVDILQVAQGRAQACAALLRLMDDCRKSADQIEEKRK